MLVASPCVPPAARSGELRHRAHDKGLGVDGGPEQDIPLFPTQDADVVGDHRAGKRFNVRKFNHAPECRSIGDGGSEADLVCRAVDLDIHHVRLIVGELERVSAKLFVRDRIAIVAGVTDRLFKLLGRKCKLDGEIGEEPLCGKGLLRVV